MSDEKDLIYKDLIYTGEPITIAPIAPARTICMTSPDGRKAVIDFGGDAVKFSGDLPIEDAAKQFFEYVFEYFKERSK